MAFSLDTASSPQTGTVRVKFTQVPKASDHTGTNDATNPANWGLTGPAGVDIIRIEPVVSDALSVDLVCSGPLAYGTWTVTASSAIQTPSLTTLTAPLSVTVDIAAVGTMAALNQGASNDTAAQVLRKHLNPVLAGPTWDALVAAIATGDEANWVLAQTIFDQLFKISATGKYLDILAAGDGLKNPAAVGLSEEYFRQLAIRSPYKVTHEAIRDILEVYFGRESIRAYCDTVAAQPFVLADGMTLHLLVDETDAYEIEFTTSQFSNILTATAVEVAAAITHELALAGSKAFAVAWLDPVSGDTVVRLFSPSKGLKSFVRVTGGTAQPALQFPTLLDVYDTFTTASWVWSATSDNKSQFVRTAADASVDLATVQSGDYVVFGSTSGTGLDQSAEIEDVSVVWSGGNYVQTVTLVENLGVTAGSYSQTDSAGLTFFRPTKAYTRNDSMGVTVSQTVSGRLDVGLPAVSRNVSRTMAQAAYGQVNSSVAIASVLRDETGLVTVTTSADHGLAVDGQVFVDGFVPSQSIAPIETVALGWQVGWVSYAIPMGSILNPVPRFPAVGTMENGAVFYIGGVIADPGTSVVENVDGTVIEFDSSTTAATGELTGKVYCPPSSSILLGTAAAATDYPVTALSGAFANTLFYCGGRSGAAFSGSQLNVPETGGIWVAGPAMGETRYSHTQTLLSDGKVAVLGGKSSVNDLRTLVYDPVANNLSYGTNSLLRARYQAGAALLDSGDVLVIGGRAATTSTNTCEIWSTSTAGRYTTQMSFARHLFATVTLDDGRVLVIGGEGYEPSQPQGITGFPTDWVDVGIFGGFTGYTTALAACEVYDPATEQWTRISDMNTARIAPYAVKRDDKIYVASVGAPTEILDLVTMTWATAPWSNQTSAEMNPHVDFLVGSPTGVLVSGGPVGEQVTDLDISFSQPYLIQPGSTVCAAGGINGQHRVLSVPTSTTFTYQSEVATYTASHGTGPGPVVFDDSGTLGLTNSVASWSDASTVTADTVTTEVAASSTSLRGPYVFDPVGEPVYAGGYTTLAVALQKGQQYRRITITTTDIFADAEGWFILGLGTDQQSQPIKYLETLPSDLGGGYLDLLVDNLSPVEDWATDTTVTCLYSRTPAQPDPEAGAFYVTGSAAGRVAAEAAVRESAAAGIDVRIEVKYPGDRGLGGEGLPVTGTKTSDKIIVWGSDEMDDLR
jgi:hypothetical protein